MQPQPGEFTNPVLFISKRFRRRGDALPGFILDPWIWIPGILFSGMVGLAFFFPRLNATFTTLSPESVYWVVLLVLAMVLGGRQSARLPWGGRGGSMRQMARELQMRPQILADLMTTPLGAPEFVQALWELHRRGIVRNAIAWCAVMVILSPPMAGLAAGLAAPKVWFPITLYFGAISLVRASTAGGSAIATSCRLLKDFRMRLTGAPVESLPGDPTSEDAFVRTMGWMAILVVPMAGAILAFFFQLLQPVHGSPLAPAKLMEISITASAFGMGLFQGFLVRTLRREAESENRRAAYLHMESILEILREEAAQPEVRQN